MKKIMNGVISAVFTVLSFKSLSNSVLIGYVMTHADYCQLLMWKGISSHTDAEPTSQLAVSAMCSSAVFFFGLVYLAISRCLSYLQQNLKIEIKVKTPEKHEASESPHKDINKRLCYSHGGTCVPGFFSFLSLFHSEAENQISAQS